MMKFIKYFILFVTASLVLGGVVAINNIYIVCTLAEGFNVPSRPYYMLFERAAKLTTSKSNSDYLRSSLIEDSHEHLHSIFIYLLGLEGDNSTVKTLSGYYDKQKASGDRAIINSCLNSMGLLGDRSFILLLESAKNDTANNTYRDYLVNRSFYLVTGHDYFLDSSGKKKFHIEGSFSDLREIVIHSAGRNRTYEEMISLDLLSRPPGW